MKLSRPLKPHRLLALLTMGLALSLSPSYSAASSAYDKLIKKYWLRYNPGVHWGYGWAQVKQESAFNCQAVSPVGAMGCSQFMPGTWRDMKKAGIVPESASAFDPVYSLEAQAYYMRTQFNGWSSRNRSPTSHLHLALAGYNAGRGHLYNAQKLCGGVMEYDEIIRCLPAITGHHSKETIQYVDKIERYKVERFGK